MSEHFDDAIRDATLAQLGAALRVVATPNRRAAGREYAAIMATMGRSDHWSWAPVNLAIIERWSVSGLDAIKREAWHILEARAHARP